MVVNVVSLYTLHLLFQLGPAVVLMVNGAQQSDLITMFHSE